MEIDFQQKELIMMIPIIRSELLKALKKRMGLKRSEIDLLLNIFIIGHHSQQRCTRQEVTEQYFCCPTSTIEAIKSLKRKNIVVAGWNNYQLTISAKRKLARIILEVEEKVHDFVERPDVIL